MRSKVSRKKRMAVISISVIVMVISIVFLIWKLSSYTKSLKMDFDKVGLNCAGITVLSDGNFQKVLSDGSIPQELITDEVLVAVQSDGAVVCALQLDYVIVSDTELDEKAFSVSVKPTSTARGKLYSYTPVTDFQKEGNAYAFSQVILLDRVDVKNFFFEKELPRPFKGSCSFELLYTLKNSGAVKKIGFHTDNQL